MTTAQKTTAILFVGVDQPQRTHPGKLRAMLPLVDKPALQIAVELLARLGCKTVHVFLEESPTVVREFLGNGERWGLRLTCHYLDEELSLAGNFKRLALDPANDCWLGHAERIPQAFIHPSAIEQSAGEIAFFHGTADTAQWTGWGLFSAGYLETLDSAPSWTALTNYLNTDPQISRQWLDCPYDLTSDQQYLDSNLRHLAWLTKAAPEQTMVARSARINPTAQITGPVYIGPHARIEAGAIVGPNAVIGHDSVIDQKAEIVKTVVLPETYVGLGLFLEEAVVAPGTLASVKNQTVVHKIEPHLLAASRLSRQRRSKRINLTAKLLRLMLFPLFLLTRLRRGAKMHSPESHLRVYRRDPEAQSPDIITLPIDRTARHSPVHGGDSWSAHFLHTFYPGLSAVATGQIDLFGLELRDVDDIATLPTDWQALYQTHSAGLLNETMLDGISIADSNMRYASDACAAGGLSTRTKYRILVSYLFHVVRDIRHATRCQRLANS